MTQTLLVDYAVPLDPRDVKAASYIAAVRYIAPPDAKYDWKRLTIHERDAIWEQGLGILPVFESYAGRALEGMSAGMEDARTALQQLQALGYPNDLPVFFACDTDTTYLKARPYFRGCSTIIPQAGAYGGINVVDPVLADKTVRWSWQTCAWSNDAHGVALVSKTAHLYQRLRPTTPLGAQYPGEFDEDVLCHPIPLWLPETPVTQPTPPQASSRPGGSGVYIFQVVDGPNKDVEVYDYGFGPVHINGPESQELIAAGIKVVPISGATYSARFAGVQ